MEETDVIELRVVTIRVEPELHQALKRMAYRREMSMNKLCLEYLERYLDADHQSLGVVSAAGETT